jgi:hypothetical protein
VPFLRRLGADPRPWPGAGAATAQAHLDELVAATLLLYPRYLDPVTGLPCPPRYWSSTADERGGPGSGGALVRLRRLQGRLKRRLAAWRAHEAAHERARLPVPAGPPGPFFRLLASEIEARGCASTASI